MRHGVTEVVAPSSACITFHGQFFAVFIAEWTCGGWGVLVFHPAILYALPVAFPLTSFLHLSIGSIHYLQFFKFLENRLSHYIFEAEDFGNLVEDIQYILMIFEEESIVLSIQLYC